MAAPWVSSALAQKAVPESAEGKAHEALAQEGVTPARIRSVVRESWSRALERHLDPDHAVADLRMSREAFLHHRETHPLTLVLPVIQKLLVENARDSGLVVAVADENGQLLWVDGDRDLRRRAEAMAFAEGADWSEATVGTNAPGTALALDREVQIHRSEHFCRLARGWSCTAVPLHDPESGRVLGVLDLTGGDEAVAPQTLPLVQAAAAAAEAELRILALRHRYEDRKTGSSGTAGASSAREPRRQPLPADRGLHVLGRPAGELRDGDRGAPLTLRHAEILTLLAWHPYGLSAEQLAERVYAGPTSPLTLRAEMVRLRKAVTAVNPLWAPTSRPYRLPVHLDVDARRIVRHLDRGAHRMALDLYRGPVLPGSEAPGIQEIRADLSGRLREAMLWDASPEVLWRYAHLAEAADDAEVWTAVLRSLPPRSPRRAGVVAQLERLERHAGLAAAE